MRRYPRRDKAHIMFFAGRWVSGYPGECSPYRYTMAATWCRRMNRKLGKDHS